MELNCLKEASKLNWSTVYWIEF